MFREGKPQTRERYNRTLGGLRGGISAYIYNNVSISDGGFGINIGDMLPDWCCVLEFQVLIYQMTKD